ncbi:MAG: pyridoxamine 5'-phosphate oxidase [Pseudomonadales bacterium]
MTRENNEVDLREVRREYKGESLRKREMSDEPISEFAVWLELAAEYHPLDSTAMVLATATLDGAPSMRTVLLKHYDQQGFCWYTNSASEKGSQLASNPKAALQFYWSAMSRQIRVSGTVTQLPREMAENYFYSRPEGARFSAAASRQSTVVQHREELETIVEKLHEQHSDGNVLCPDDWSGYRLLPEKIEFWQGRENRLHDRIVYQRDGNGWAKQRLAP